MTFNFEKYPNENKKAAFMLKVKGSTITDLQCPYILIIEEDIWQIRRPQNMPSNSVSFKYYFYFNEPFSQAYEINQMSLATKEKAKFLHLKLQSRIQVHCC